MIYYQKNSHLFAILTLNIIAFANAFELQDGSCCAYKNQVTLKEQCCAISKYTYHCCSTCDSTNNPTGLSYNCTSFNITNQPNNKKEVYYPIGESINFNIFAFQRECTGPFCTRAYATCTLACACCKMYIGEDPGFKVNIWAPNGEGPTYSQYLNCTFPTWVPNPNGTYKFSCILTGWNLASALKPLQLQLTSLAWLKLSNKISPISIDVRYVAGNVSLQNCFWQWERSNSFLLKEYGTIKITLNDGYGNKIWGLTGGREIKPDDFIISFQKYGYEETLTPQESPVFAKLSSRHAFGICIVSVYSTQVGSFLMTIADARGNKLKDMPTVFYVLPDSSAQDLIFNKQEFSVGAKTYFSGDEFKNDFVISRSLFTSVDARTICWLSVCIFILTWIDTLNTILVF